MQWIEEPYFRILILFTGLFVLSGLEFFFPLIKRKSTHHWVNILLTITLIATNFLFSSFTLFLSEWCEHRGIGLFHIINVSPTIMILISVVTLDFWAAYVSHYLFHKVSSFWKFHSVHHSDIMIDVTTSFRQHPIESGIRILFHLSGLIFLGIPVWILLIYLTVSSLNAQLEHSNIKLPMKLDKILQLIFVTPNMHKVHHSAFQQETDSNYGNVFSVWDRIFGTYKERSEYHSINFGLDYLDRRSLSFWELIKLPFKANK